MVRLLLHLFHMIFWSATKLGRDNSKNSSRWRLKLTIQISAHGIQKTKLNTFSKKRTSNKATTKLGNVVGLRNDSKFISRLLAISQCRDIDMRNLMKYSLRKYPAPLATSNGELVKTPKCKLMHELLHRANCNDHPPSNTDTLLVDGMAILQTPKDIPQTFGDLAEKVVRIGISSAKKARGNRVDFICDTYPPISIKSIKWEKRSMSGVSRVRIGGATQLEVFVFRRKQSRIDWVFFPTYDDSWSCRNTKNATYFVTHGANCHRFFVDSDNKQKIESVPELYSNHEEADTRLILHAHHASTMHNIVTIRSPDTDVFILMLAHKVEIRSSLFFVTGFGNKRRLIHVNEVYDQLGSRLCNARIGFHAFTGLNIL